MLNAFIGLLTSDGRAGLIGAVLFVVAVAALRFLATGSF